MHNFVILKGGTGEASAGRTFVSFGRYGNELGTKTRGENRVPPLSSVSCPHKIGKERARKIAA